MPRSTPAPKSPCRRCSQMEALPYSNMVIREAMRLYPPVWVISRKHHRGRHARRLHRAARHRRVLQPLLRAPSSGFLDRCREVHARALRAAGRRPRPKLTYLPFSAGAHHCIGETLAIFEMLVHLNRFARRFQPAPRRQRTGGVRGADQPARHAPIHHAARAPRTETERP